MLNVTANTSTILVSRVICIGKTIKCELLKRERGDILSQTNCYLFMSVGYRTLTGTLSYYKLTVFHTIEVSVAVTSEIGSSKLYG